MHSLLGNCLKSSPRCKIGAKKSKYIALQLLRLTELLASHLHFFQLVSLALLTLASDLYKCQRCHYFAAIFY